MHAAKRASRGFGVGVTLLAAPLAAGQFLPIRELDTNGLVASETPVRLLDGRSVGSGSSVPVLWDAAGSNLLPLLLGTYVGVAQDLGRSGDMVGWCRNPLAFDTPSSATLWRGGAALDLNSLATGGDALWLSNATGIDRKGRIAGGGVESHLGRAFLFDQGVVTKLPTLLGGNTISYAVALDDHLELAGVSNGADLAFHAVMWVYGQILDLHDPAQISGVGSTASDIDRFGRVCGSAGFKVRRRTQRLSAVLWDHGVVTDLGANVASPSEALGINDFGAIVGYFHDPVLLVDRACRFEAGGVTDLNSLIDPALGWSLTRATAIDGEGRIAGIGTLNGVPSAFLLDPGCKGFFTKYGSGCPGSGGVEPELVGAGCPAPERDFALLVQDGVANGMGVLLIGSGTGSVRVKPGCEAQVMPLAALPLPILLDGFGESWMAARLPAGTALFDLYFQFFGFDPGAPSGLSASKPLQTHFE